MGKILITGCNGQVGYFLAKNLLNKHEILAVDRSQLDITNRDAVFEIVATFKPNVIINAAAYTAVDKAEEQAKLAEAVNVHGAGYLAEAAEKIGSAILHISTDYVFDGEGDGVYKETDVTNPQGVYGRTKLGGEKTVQEACERSIILRTAWVFGEHGNNFVKTMLRLGVEREALNIVSDQVGGPTYAGDIAYALIAIADRIISGEIVEYGVYHFTGEPHVSWFEFAETIFDEAISQGVLEKSPALNPISTEEYPTPAKRPANSTLDSAKIQKAFNLSSSDWRLALKNIHLYI